MKMVFDPITDFIDKFAWVAWAILWISLSLGVGQEEFVIPGTAAIPDRLLLSIVASILLLGCVLLQTVRQLYYSNEGPPLVRLGRWIILGATSIFAFRMLYMISAYGSATSSIAALVGVCLLAVGLSLNAIGMMQQSYFREHGSEKLKWNNSWRNV